MSETAGRALSATFAEHLRRRTDTAAGELCDALRHNGETRRAEFLDVFATDGPHTRSAEWWEPEAHCSVSLLPPSLDEMVSGQLWFDPLELTWSMAVPWPPEPGEQTGDFPHLPDFLCWFPLDRVTDWQLAGAHLISSTVPGTMAGISATTAWNYCTLFGKALLGHSTWGMIARIFGSDTALRLWGDSPGEVSPGGTHDGDALMLYRHDIVNLADPDAPYPQETGEEDTDGLCFRADFDLQHGLIQEDHTLDRVWNASTP